MGDAVGLFVRLEEAAGRVGGRVPARRLAFAAPRCLRFDGRPTEITLIRTLATYLAALPRLVLVGGGPLHAALVAVEPGLATASREPQAPPPEGATLFLTPLPYVERLQLHQRFESTHAVLDITVLAGLAPALLPPEVWAPLDANVYPIHLPVIAFEPGLDIVLLDCPARFSALKPNGLAYVHNALKRAAVRHQTFDLDIVAYHRFHMERLFDCGGRMVTPGGRMLPEDPWDEDNYDLWCEPELLDVFQSLLEDVAAALIAAAPKILGLSLHSGNQEMARRLVARLRPALPEMVILVGGYSCYNAQLGLSPFPEADYLCVKEADLTVGPLVEALARGERPRNQPGVVSRWDDPEQRYHSGPVPHNLDLLPMPTYDWFGSDIYHKFNGPAATPIVASRGCRWSRCTFCAERFYWRIRSAANVVDEMEWLVSQGCTRFVFNESDLNGLPERLLEICDEIIRRRLVVRLSGQLRIHKKSDRAFFDRLRQAGFTSLRFGVDGFSDHTLKLQKKGYTTNTVVDNLKACSEAGIYVVVNWVIGIPGETDEDIEDGIALLLRCRPYILMMANLNPLILSNGSVYWDHPEAHGIHFIGDKTELYARYPSAIPSDLWHSVNPFIDTEVRKRRFLHIAERLHGQGFPMGGWAERVIEDIRLRRDRARSGDSGGEGAEVEAPGALTPVRLRPFGTHEIYLFQGRTFAIPTAAFPDGWGGGDLTGITGVISGSSREEVVVALNDGGGVATEAPLVVCAHGVHYAIDPHVFAAAFPGLDRGAVRPRIEFCVSEGERPVFHTVIDGYRVLSFGGLCYGVPPDAPFDPTAGPVPPLPGLIVSRSPRETIAQILARRL